MNYVNSFNGLTSREQKALENSWARTFAEDIFPSINEEPFRALYSGSASRPSISVNICIGALIIKGPEHYCSPNDYNKTFYYNSSSGTEEQLKTILEDTDRLLSICGPDYDGVTEYQLLERCLSEQTVA